MVDPIAVQLYTLRNLLERDFVGTLQRVAAVGYRAVELYSYGGLSPQDLRKRLDDLGLRAVSAHVLLARLEQDLGNVLEEAHTIGLDYIVCPWLPPERRRTPDDYDRLADLLDRVGETAAQAGVQLAYHNHDFEFARLGETVALDRLLTRTRPDRVQAELDLFWIHQAGCNPVDYIQRYAGRLHLLHVKDVHASDGSFAEVGQGVLPWRELLSTARAAGVRWYIVEQDVCPRDPIASIEASLTFLRKQFSQFQDEHPIGT